MARGRRGGGTGAGEPLTCPVPGLLALWAAADRPGDFLRGGRVGGVSAVKPSSPDAVLAVVAGTFDNRITVMERELYNYN